MEEIGRKHSIHLDVHDRRDTPAPCFPHCLHERAETDSSEFRGARATDRRMALGENVAGWPVRNYA